MPNAIYNSFKRDIANGSIDLDTDSIKIMLVTSTYVANIDTHAKRSDITNEISGSGYTSGGVVLIGKSVTMNTTTDKGVFDADDVTISTATITARAGILYKSRGGASSADELIAYLDFGSDVACTAGNFNIAFDVNGIITLG
jgi:hypothetical protein